MTIPSYVRFALYALTSLGTPVVLYLASIGELGPKEVALWGAEVTAVTALATAKTGRDS